MSVGIGLLVAFVLAFWLGRRRKRRQPRAAVPPVVVVDAEQRHSTPTLRRGLLGPGYGGRM